MANNRLKVVRVHRQALEMGEAVQQHLAANPRDSILFLIDWERALRDLGYEVSKGMREHLGKQRPIAEPLPGASELYDYVRNGGELPFGFEGNVRFFGMKKTPNASLLSGSSGTDRLVPMTTHDSRRETLIRTVSSAMTVPNTAGYSVVIQLTENAINEALGVAYLTGLFPSSFSGSRHLPWTEYQVDSGLSFHLDLARPSISFTVPDVSPDAVMISLGVTGSVTLDVTILQYFNPTHPEFRDAATIAFEAVADVVVTARVIDVDENDSAVCLDFQDIQRIDFRFTSIGVSEDLREYLVRLLKRILRTRLQSHPPPPLTFQFNRRVRGGIPIEHVHSKIIPAAGEHPGTLSICIDTTGNGVLGNISHLVPREREFIVVSTRHFLLDQAWARVGRPKLLAYSHPDVRFEDARLDLLTNGHIYFWVAGEEQKTCFEVDFTADMEVIFENFPVDKNCFDPNTGEVHPCHITKTRLRPIVGPNIHISTLARILLTILGGLLLGAIGAILVNIIIEILEDKLGSAAGDLTESFSVGFYQNLPRTNVTVVASCREAIIEHEGIYASGDVEFVVDP